MGNIGGGEILIVLFAALIFLGPSKLPEAARQIGKAMGEFRKVTGGFQRELREAMNDGDDTTNRTRNAPKPVVAEPAAVPAVEPVDAVITEAVTADAVPDVAPPPAEPAVEPVTETPSDR